MCTKEKALEIIEELLAGLTDDELDCLIGLLTKVLNDFFADV